MEDVRIKFLGTNSPRAFVKYGDKKGSFENRDSIKLEYLYSYLNEGAKNGLQEIRGLDKNYKFIITNGENKVTIENVTKEDEDFKWLDSLATVKVNMHKKVAKYAAMVALATSLTITGIKAFPSIREGIRIAQDEHEQYNQDYNQVANYYYKLLDRNISSSELVMFEDLTLECLDKYNMSDEDRMFFNNCLEQISDYKEFNSNKPFRM